VKVALIVGIILSSPIWLYQVWAFVTPGLHTREKRWSYIFLAAAVPLFGIGITLCYLSLGRSMHYLLGLTPGGVQNLIQVDQYMSFTVGMMLAFGLAFEVPLLLIMLNPKRLMQKHLLDDLSADQRAQQQPARQAAANGTPPMPGERRPFDPNAT
jgi:Tat protein translocase TatC